MTTEPCSYCDTYGPFLVEEQTVRDLHRAWHELGRATTRALAPLMAAFREVAEAAQNATAASYALIPDGDPVTFDPPTPLEVWRVEVDDDVKLTRKMATVFGRVTRVDISATRGTGVHLEGRPTPYWIGPRHDSWTLTEHHPAIPPVLHTGALYEIVTTDARHLRAHWSPIDGIRANHPWLHPDGETRYRQGLVARARLADPKGARS